MNILKRRIERALGNNWSMNNLDIQVLVVGHAVKLHGNVEFPYQKDQAERLAWFISEVWSVENNLVVDLSYQQMATAN